MPGDDLTLDYHEDGSVTDYEDDFKAEHGHEEWEPDTGVEEADLIAAVDIGGVLDIQSFINSKFGHPDFRDRLAFEDDTLEALKHLISLGAFEVLDRDQYNGGIKTVRRVR